MAGKDREGRIGNRDRVGARWCASRCGDVDDQGVDVVHLTNLREGERKSESERMKEEGNDSEHGNTTADK